MLRQLWTVQLMLIIKIQITSKSYTNINSVKSEHNGHTRSFLDIWELINSLMVKLLILDKLPVSVSELSSSILINKR